MSSGAEGGLGVQRLHSKFVRETSVMPWRSVIWLLACWLAIGGDGFAETSVERKPLKVVALGTSLTHSGGWLKLLEQKLTGCLERSISVIDFGRNGATSEWGVAVLDEVIHAEPDVVLVEFSVNDAALFKGISLGRSRENVRRIVRTVERAKPHVKIFLMTMNPSFGPHAWIRPRIGAYYKAYGALADELGTGYIDNLRDWENLTQHELSVGVPDGLHPKPEWARRILVPAVSSAIATAIVGTACVQAGIESTQWVGVLTNPSRRTPGVSVLLEDRLQSRNYD